MLRSIFIDDSGEVLRREGAIQLATPYATFMGQKDEYSNRVVDELGYVRIDRDRRLGVVLTFNSTSIKLPCLLRAVRWLTANKPERVVLQDNGMGNAPTQILRCGPALERLRDMCSERRTQPRFRRRPSDINNSHFATRWEAAREILNAGLNLDIQSHILSKLFQQHFVVTERDPSSGHFLLVDAGLAVESRMYNLGTLQIGSPFTALEDAQFGHWIAEGLREFTPSNKPVTEVLEVGLQSKIGTARTLRYTRLVVPYAREGRDHLFTTANIERC
ncbi:MAG: hypothetical protein ABL898_08365 [Hyphomicrobiaceae bacterium]